MITTTVFTPLADAAAARYDMLVAGWQGIFVQGRGRRDLGSARAFSRAHSDAYGLAMTHLAGEAEHIGEALTTVAQNAQGAALAGIGASLPDELSDAASELLAASGEALRFDLAVQAERDVAHLVRQLRQQALQVTIAARSQGIPVATALFQNQVGDQRDLRFFFHDRAGAKWPSRKFVRGVWRHALLTLHNEVTLLTLADHGVAEVAIEHASAKAEVHGMRLALSPNSALPTYAEVKAEIFHPNADAILVPVEPE